MRTASVWNYISEAKARRSNFWKPNWVRNWGVAWAASTNEPRLNNCPWRRKTKSVRPGRAIWRNGKNCRISWETHRRTELTSVGKGLHNPFLAILSLPQISRTSEAIRVHLQTHLWTFSVLWNPRPTLILPQIQPSSHQQAANRAETLRRRTRVTPTLEEL